MIACLRSQALTPADEAPRMVAEGRLVAVKGHLSPALVGALGAIPGVPVDVRGMSWALRIGPDRAASVRRVAEHHSVEMNVASGALLSELCAQRDLCDPVVEITERGGVWLSVMEDWLSLAVEELRAVPGCRPQAAAGRIEVPVTPWTLQPLRRTIAAHGLRLSRGARRALDGVSASASEAEPEPVAAAGSGPEVRMDPGG